MAISVFTSNSDGANLGAQNNPLYFPQVSDFQLRVVQPTLLELTRITTKAADPAPVTEWNFVGANFTPALPPASTFSVLVNGQPVAVTTVGFKRRPVYAPLLVRDLRIGNQLFLKLASAMPGGAVVSVTDLSGTLWPETMTFSTESDVLRNSPAIHVNQSGYGINFSKKAMVGYYLGSLGEMPVTAGTAFQIIDRATTNVVHQGLLVRRADVGYTYLATPYQQVLEADFSTFNQAGEYLLVVPDLGSSLPFRIHSEAASVFARTYALGLYHQRCGTSNSMPFSRFVHDACHTASVDIPTTAFSVVNAELANMSSDYANNPRHTAPQLSSVSASLYPFVNQGKIDVSAGHHDAGDYSKYTINSAALVHFLTFAADNFPGVAGLDNLGLPESGDGKSDLLQEAKLEADFLAKMQDADGGFYFLVYPRDREYKSEVLPDHGDPQVVFPKTTAVTAAAVGALAEIGSSPEFKRLFPTEAAGYLDKAVRGWTFLMNALASHGKDGSYQKITHYGNEFMHDDELAWAAAALFVATGDPQYSAQLMQWYDPSDANTRRWTWWRLFEGYGCAARAYAFAARSGRLSAAQLDASYLGKCQAEIIAAADDVSRFALQTAYGTSFPDPSKSFRSAGWFFSMERAFDIATGYQLQTKPSYLETMLSNMNYEGGCNPLNLSFLTGLGQKRQREIVHQYAQNDRRVLPPSGIPLGNIQGGFAWLQNYQQELGNLVFPADGANTDPYPFYDRWGDTFNTTTEFVVVDAGRGLATTAFLMALSGNGGSKAANTAGEITGFPSEGVTGQNMTVALNAPGIDLTQAVIVWEARDQQPFLGATFTFAPISPGDQWIEAEAQLPNGERIFATASFTARSSANGGNIYQSAPLAVSSEMAALFHFDSDVNDATGKNPALTLAGTARLDTMNLAWMAQPSGAALRISDLGDKATLTIPTTLLYGPATTEVSIEAMIYVNAYKGYNRSSAQLLSLQKTWNASLELREDKYSGAHTRGGSQFDWSGAELNAALPVQKWNHLRISINPTGYTVHVNGQLVKSVTSSELVNWGGGQAVLELGNFDGWIDEVCIRNRTSAPQPVPIPPQVQITSPVNSSTFNAPANILLVAGASDADGTVAKVEFFAGTTKVGEVLTAPYQFTWAGVSAGNYSLTARATDNSGSITVSAAIQVTVQNPPPPPPSAPNNLLANATSGLIDLSWQGSTGAASYNLKRSMAAAGPFQVIAATVSTTFQDTTVINGTTYYYTVSAENAGGESLNSNIASGTPQAPPAAPSQLAATIPSANQIRLTWIDQSNNESNFQIERSSDGVSFTRIATLAANAQSYLNTGLQPNRLYYYRVRAVNATGASGYSNRVSIRTSKK